MAKQIVKNSDLRLSNEGSIVAGQMTKQMIAFADHYLTCFNENEAAKVAGYTSYHVQGAKLLKNERIQKYIEERKTKINQSIQKPFDLNEWIEWMRLLQKMVFGNPMPVLKLNMLTKKMDHETNEVGGILYGVYKIDGSTAIKMLDSIGKYLGIFIDKIQVDGITPEMMGKLSPEEQAMLYNLYQKMKS